MNTIQNNIIIESKINKNKLNIFQMIENHNNAINAARKIGLHIINIDSNDLINGNV